ncbi:MAG: NAD-dependent epimerase/dehydratase family protein [Gemmatimonadota bacterium]|nr:NAD-dependent epimerase/dehydratase family protein [Gemmatimonadota bacterium]
MSARVLVTGASGFIGSYLTRRLLSDDIPVRVLVRNPGKLPPDVREKVEVIRGDIANPRMAALMSHATEDVHTVYHLAACARAWSRDPNEFWRANVDAVNALLEGSERHGVARLVHVSTVLTLTPHRHAPVQGSAAQPTPYESTKSEGEQLVEAYAAAGRHAVIVHPTRVFGPGPLNDANGVTKAIALYVAGRLRVRLADHDVQANYVHADDVAEGMLRAAEHGHNGTHYVLGGENASFREFLEIVAEIADVRRFTIPLPRGVAMSVARIAETWARIGGTAPITRGWIRIFLEDRRVDIEPARRDLGYKPRSLRDGLAGTIRWLEGKPKETAA